LSRSLARVRVLGAHPTDGWMGLVCGRRLPRRAWRLSPRLAKLSFLAKLIIRW
jgi:hypothetical protein